MIISKLFVLSSLIFTLTGCAGIVISPVSDKDRTSSNEFDGAYSFPATGMAERQSHGSSRYICRGESRALSTVVKDGVLTAYYGTEEIKTNVNSEGRFHLVIPTDFSYSQLSNSSPGSEISYIYSGQLGNPGKSTFTIGKKSENNLGCSTKVTVEKR